MAEVRVDPLSGARVVVASSHVELEPQAQADAPRVLPALDGERLAPEPDAIPNLFGALAAGGGHELIAGDLEHDAAATLERWRERMRAHAGAACLHVCVERAADAELYAFDFVPAAIARERERFGAHAVRTMGGNLLAEVLQEEVRRRERIVAIDDEAVLLAPYASARPYQLMLVPRQPRARFEADGATGASLLRDGLGRLGRRFGARPPLRLWVRTAPRGAEHFCWRIDVVPQLRAGVGPAAGTGVHVNAVAPERAARELREA